MASMQEKSQCVLWFHESHSPVTVQRREYGRDPPDVKSIKGWHDKFKETGSVGDKRSSGRPGVLIRSVQLSNAVCRNRRNVPPEKLAYLRTP